eukprot:3323921-Pleurochrysis_carterae.AAC.6
MRRGPRGRNPQKIGRRRRWCGVRTGDGRANWDTLDVTFISGPPDRVRDSLIEYCAFRKVADGVELVLKDNTTGQSTREHNCML